MPNHVRNVIKIKNIPKEYVQYVIDKCASWYTDHYIIDFDLIIPEPRYKSDCPKEYVNKIRTPVEKLTGREWFNWYDWHVENWGTKWNAYDGYTIIKPSQVVFVFSTAWSCPSRVINKLLTVLPDYDIEARYADEDIGHNCGILTYNAKDKSVEITTDDDMSANQARAFSRYIWNNY